MLPIMIRTVASNMLVKQALFKPDMEPVQLTFPLVVEMVYIECASRRA